MYKQVTFAGYDNRTGPHIFPIEADVDRSIGHIKMARELPSTIEAYIRNSKPIKGKTQLLIDAMGAGEYYGCFPSGTLIQTDDGEVPIEKIKPGTMVLTHLNRYRPVKALLPQQAQELCDLQVKGLPSNVPALTSTPNHELWVILRDDFIRAKRKHIWKGDTSTSLKSRRNAAMLEMPFSWVAITDLRSGDMVAEPFPMEEDSCSLGDKKWNTPEVAFLMGLYAAEGCVSIRGDRGSGDEPGSIVYVTGSHETATHRRAMDCAKKLGYTITPRPGDSNETRMQLCFKRLAELCAENIGRNAVSKFLSDSILRMPVEWQKTFFQAYADGDGCVRGVGKEEGTIRCVSASTGLLRGFRLLLARQGIAASISGRHNTKATWYSGKPIYELMLSAGQLGERSSSKSYIHPDGYILSSVKKTKTYEWQGEVFDLSVEEDTSYVASGITVHNSNVNGDFFPHEALSHEGPDYGYKTFMMYAYPFRHHVNKNPARAYGDKVVLSAYDPKMHRVLLIVRVNDEKCRDILEDIENGNYADVSMGCRVPWDECSICHNRAKNRAEYCTHLRYQMNKILQNGQRVFAYNRLPKFFDISFVTIGAEKASHILKKVAHAGGPEVIRSSAEIGELYYGKLAAAEKAAEQNKRAEIEKDVPSNPAANIAPATPADKAKVDSFMGNAGAMKSTEAPIPNGTLDRMAQHPMKEIFTTLAALGVDLRPNEFQRIVLMKQGGEKLASFLESKKIIFDERSPAPSIPKWAMDFRKFDDGAINEKVAMIIRPWLVERSCLPDILQHRLSRLEKSAAKDYKYDKDSQWHPMSKEQKRNASGMHGLVPASAALAAGFMVFRNIFPGLQTSGPAPIRAIAKHPWLLPMLIGAGVGASVGFQTMTTPMPLTKEGTARGLDAKKASSYHGAIAAGRNTSSPIDHGMVTLAYVYSQTHRPCEEQQTGHYDRLIAQRPELAALSKVATQTRHASQDANIFDAIRRIEK